MKDWDDYEELLNEEQYFLFNLELDVHHVHTPEYQALTTARSGYWQD